MRLSGVKALPLALKCRGLAEIVSNTGTIQNIDPTTAAGAFFKANVFGTAGTPVPLDEMDMENAIDTAEEKRW